jgi:chromosomal replication initiation ATPase DnaA
MRQPAQHIFEFAAQPALDRASLLTSPSNQLAVEWVERWPDWPRPVLAVHGPEGSGKTHLARIWQGLAGALLLQPEDLSEAALTWLARSPRNVVLDNAEGVAGDAAQEESLLHLYNLIGEHQKFLLLIGRAAPARWKINLPDLASRLGSVPAVGIEQPDDVLLQKLLTKLFTDRQLILPADVLSYLLARMERSFAAAERVAGDLDKLSLAHQRRLTVALARMVLEETA